MDADMIRAFAEEFTKEARKQQRKVKRFIILGVLAIFILGCLIGKFIL